MSTQRNLRTLRASIAIRVALSALVVAVACALVAGYSVLTFTVNVFADGQAVSVETASRSSDAIVRQAGVVVGKDDKVDETSFRIGADIKDGNAIIVYRAVPVSIYEDGELLARVNAAGTIADALEKSGLKMGGDETTELDPDTLLKENMRINLLHSYQILLKVGGKVQKVNYAAGTVGDVLKRAHVTLGPNDTVKPSLSKTLKPGSKIVVHRVSYVVREEEKVMKYGTQTRQSGVLAVGVNRIARQGRDGSKTITYEDKVVDGEVVSSKKLEETVSAKPVDKVIVEGTRQPKQSTPAVFPNFEGRGAGAPPPTNYIKTFHGPATAYTAKPGARNASGGIARRGTVAVNPKQIPYGSKLYIVADDGTVYGYCTAEDTGGFVTNGSGTMVDLYMDTYGECTRWGKRPVTIYVISWGNGKR